jgi:hypothetical protein
MATVFNSWSDELDDRCFGAGALCFERAALTVGPRFQPNTVSLVSVRTSRFLSPFLASTSLNSNFHILSSKFTQYLSQVARIESAVQAFHQQRLLSEEFAMDIRDTAFTDIMTSRAFGGAFYAISEIHTLRC